MSKENLIEEKLIKQLTELKYTYRADIVDLKTLEQNFKSKFEALNRVYLTENEFLRLHEEIINADVFAQYFTIHLLELCTKNRTFEQSLIYE